MLNLHNFKGFAVHNKDTSYEFKSIHVYCTIHDIPIIKTDTFNFDYVHSGSVEYVLKILNKKIIPNYYPEFLKNHLYRNTWKSDTWILGKKLFVKPADKHKRFNGFCTFGTYSKKKKPPYYYSDIINFTNEWRYYISNGKVLDAHWYMGDEINTPDAPPLNISIPNTFTGTLDFGTTTNNNEFALVEAHEPFGCGWYGKMGKEEYVQWLVDGWMYMLQNF